MPGRRPDRDRTRWAGYRFEDELPKAGQYEIGSLAMANAGPNTNGSQFFIISGPQGTQLPPQYSLFGKVVKDSRSSARCSGCRPTATIGRGTTWSSTP